jgi:hypothetical protein
MYSLLNNEGGLTMKIKIANEHFNGNIAGLEFVNGVHEVAEGHEKHSAQIANFLGYEIIEEAKKPKAKAKAAAAKDKEKAE